VLVAETKEIQNPPLFFNQRSFKFGKRLKACGGKLMWQADL